MTTPVGPQASSPDPVYAKASAPAPATAAGASASQVVSGTVGSTSGVSIDGAGGASYHGTEPALMTVSHDGGQTTVTVTPR